MCVVYMHTHVHAHRCGHTCHCHMCGNQKTTFKNRICPSAIGSEDAFPIVGLEKQVLLFTEQFCQPDTSFLRPCFLNEDKYS